MMSSWHVALCSTQWIGMVYIGEQKNSLTSTMRCAWRFHYTLSQQPRITSQPWGDFVTMEMLCQCWLVSWLWRKRKLCPVKKTGELPAKRDRPYQHTLSLIRSIILFIFNLLRLNSGLCGLIYTGICNAMERNLKAHLLDAHTILPFWILFDC